MKRLLVAILALTALAARAENWKPIVTPEDRSATFFVDESAFKVDGSTVEFLVKSNHKLAPHVAYWKVDCKSGDASILFIKYLEESSNTTKMIYGPMKMEHEERTVADYIFIYACRKAFI